MEPAKTLRKPARPIAKAQLSIVEHALSPLDTKVSLTKGLIHETTYQYTDRNRNRKQASVRVGCVDGISAHDELYLWGILGLALAGNEPSSDFYATPYWILRQLGRISPAKKGTKDYQLFRNAIRRLAGVRYENTAFYDPLRGEHRHVSFGLLNFSLPLDDDASRAWRFAFDPIFWELIAANRSSLRFDMELYSSLTAAARRMYLFLKKQFWRNESTGKLDLRQTATNVVGFNNSLPTFTLKKKMRSVIEELVNAEIVATPDSATQLFVKKGVGEYRFRLHRGSAFDRAGELGTGNVEDSPLFDPLTAIGFDRDSITRLIRQHPSRLLSQWADITLVAMKNGIIDKSPQAYFTYYVNKKATPHDWWHELKKKERQQESEQERAKSNLNFSTDQDTEFRNYIQSEAKDAFEKVMQSMLGNLTQGGMPQPQAERFAREQTERHFRSRFQKRSDDFSNPLI